MMPVHEQEIAANLERAEQSIQAAKDLAIKGYHDFAASRVLCCRLRSHSILTERGFGFE
jgi:hypothetical protein